MQELLVAGISAAIIAVTLPLITVISALWTAFWYPKDPLKIWLTIRASLTSKIAPSFGRWLFSFILGAANPYSRSMKIRFQELEFGYVEAYVDECNSIRNPFKSIHAAALVLLAETVGGLAVYTTLNSKKDRAIVLKIDCEYMKKSRGRITAKCAFKKPESSGKYVSEVLLTDSKGEVVAKSHITWTLDVK